MRVRTRGDIYDVTLKMLENPENPSFTLHGLKEDKTYFFTITAYDSEARESSFSEAIIFKSPEAN